MVWSQFLLTLSALLQAQSSIESSQILLPKTGEFFFKNIQQNWKKVYLTFIFSEIETFDPEVPLNLTSKASTIWSPARTLENSVTNYATPNLPIFNQGSSCSSNSSDRRSKKGSNEDLSKIFPVSEI